MIKSRILAVAMTAGLAGGLSAQTCLTTLFADNNGGSVGGSVYFDITANKAVRIVSLETNYSATASTKCGIQVWLTPKTSVGKEGNKTLWTMVGKDNGKAVSAGRGKKTKITLASPILLKPGSYGISLVAVGSGHAYTNGTATNTKYKDSNLSLVLGKASNTPFSTSLFSPRVWNGTICYTLGKGLFSDFKADKTSGPGPLTVQFTDTTYTSSAGGVKGWSWDFNGDNKIDSTAKNPKWTFPKTTWDATYDVTLTTTDGVNPASKVTKKAFITVDPSNAFAVNFGKGSSSKPLPVPIAQPKNTSHYSYTAVRGFYFQAPTTLVINGFEAPNTYTPKEPLQTVTCYVLSKAPPEYSSSYTPKTSEVRFHATAKANQVMKPAKPIVVSKGQWVGVLGACHGTAATAYNRNSYGAGNYKSSVLGLPITLKRLIMQVNHRGNKGVGPISANGTASIGRVFVHVAGNNAVPTLDTIGAPQLGKTATLDLVGRVPGAQGGVIVLSTGRLPTPIPTIFGNLLVKPSIPAVFAVPTGTGKLPLPVPANSTLKGVKLDFQALIFNLTTNTFGMSNGTEWFLGK